MSFSTASESSRLLDPRLEGSKKSMSSISALKELVRLRELELPWSDSRSAIDFIHLFIYIYSTLQCMMEGLGVEFLLQPSLSSNSTQKDEICAQVCTLLLMQFNHIPVEFEDIYLSGIHTVLQHSTWVK